MTITLVGVGSNLHDPLLQFQQLEHYIASQPKQPHYCNAVLLLSTVFDWEQLLRLLQFFETCLGRTYRPYKWSPRVIDLDILLYGDQTITNDRIRIPHAEMLLRPFVMFPLQEVGRMLRDWRHPYFDVHLPYT